MIGIVLLGPPGVGKGTQAAHLKEALHLLHLSTGDVLRQAVRNGTPIGLRVKSVMESGALVSDDLVGEVVDAALESGLSSTSGFLLDGFPRTLRQVEILDALLTRRSLGLDHVLLIDAPEAVVLRRLTGRRVCSSCSALYHLDSKPPLQASRCDACGSGLAQRPDDRETAVGERLRVYRAETAPVAAVYRERGLLRPIDGSRSPQAVFATILTVVRGVAA